MGMLFQGTGAACTKALYPALTNICDQGTGYSCTYALIVMTPYPPDPVYVTS